MKKIILLLSVLLLSGCLKSGVVISQQFPDVPADLLVACPDLKQVDPTTTKLSEVLPVIVDNYTEYQECKIKIDTWIQWYTNQQSIYNSVK
jgi:hypothetical protein